MKFAGFLCAIVTFLMAALHIALLLGVPIGEFVLGGKEKIIPLKNRWINAIFSLLFLFLGILYMGIIGIISFNLPVLITKTIVVSYTLFLAYAIIGNTLITKSKKEKYLMIPASTIGFISSLITLIYIW